MSFFPNTKDRDWRYGSSSRVPASQEQSPEFKPQFCPKKKNNKIK
jgi:hypothetical protein